MQIVVEIAAFKLFPLIPVSWLISSVEPFWKPQETRIPRFAPAAANNS